MKRRFGTIEAVFDLLYLTTALLLGVSLLLPHPGEVGQLFGLMALVLVTGDAFHLIPRICAALEHVKRNRDEQLGRGKQLTSVGMTVFYVFLWHIGLLCYGPPPGASWTVAVYALAALRIFLCLLPQNRWGERDAPQSWNIYRNLPFLLLGGVTAGFFFVNRQAVPGLEWMWLAIALSFACYLPVVLWSKRFPPLGMLMLPKSCAYLWMISMGLHLGLA